MLNQLFDLSEPKKFLGRKKPPQALRKLASHPEKRQELVDAGAIPALASWIQIHQVKREKDLEKKHGKLMFILWFFYRFL